MSDMSQHRSSQSTTTYALTRVMAIAFVLGSPGCVSSSGERPFVPTSGDDSGTGTSTGTFDAGATGAAPSIEILAPTDGVLLSAASAPKIRAKITTTSGLLDPATLTFTLMDAASATSMTTTNVASGPLSGPTIGSEYAGRLDLSQVPSGNYVLAVRAATTTGATTTKTITLRVDTGPRITVVSPIVDSHHKGTLLVSVVVESAPFEPTALPLEASVAGRNFDLPAISAGSTSYQGSVNFQSYDPPLRGEQLLTIAAKNANGTRSQITVRFVVDEDGPVIEPLSPLPHDVVGRVIEVRARIHDDAGVVDSSVIALIGDEASPQFKLNLLSRGNEVYGASFDTALLTRCGLTSGGLPTPGTFCNVYPTISFRASDTLGNETAIGYSFGIDNQPPLLDLDPPEIRVSRRKSTLQCSWAFDPLGDHTISGNMPDDDCAVGQVFQLRARAEDDVNGARFLQVAPLATIDSTRISVFILNDSAQPLTVDSDGDGICDLINPRLIPTTSPPTSSREVLKIRLSPVPPQGVANFMPDSSVDGDLRCDKGDDPVLPKLLCRDEEPTVAISYGPKLPAIWSLDPIEPDGLRCFGNQFDAYANHIGGSRTRGNNTPAPGWACIAVQATDMVGNTGVSAPLRVWIDYDGEQTCPASSAGAIGSPPDCTGHVDLKTGTVTTTPCQSRKFSDAGGVPELCLNGNCG